MTDLPSQPESGGGTQQIPGAAPAQDGLGGAHAEQGRVSPGLAARIAAALDVADIEHRYPSALDMMRFEPALAPDAEQQGISVSDRVAAMLCKGGILYRMRRYADSLRMSAMALRLAPTSAHAWYNVANVYFAIGDARRALRIVERGLAVADPPEIRGLLALKASVLAHLRRYREALPIFMQLQDLPTTGPAVWMRAADVFVSQGRAPEAVALARRAIAHTNTAVIAATVPNAWAVLGDALRGVGDHEGARAAYNEQLRHHPNDRRAQAGLARLWAVDHRRRGRWARSVQSVFYARSLLVLGWAERLRVREYVAPELAAVVKQEHLEGLCD